MVSMRRTAREARAWVSSKLKAMFTNESALEQATKATWKHLFAFTFRGHLPTLLLAIFTTVISSGLRAFLAVTYGRIFDVIADLGADSISGHEALKAVSTWCLILTGMGIGTWLSNSLLMSMWIIFGEAQALNVRREIFGSLSRKDMAWYDGQVEGTASLLTRIETQTRELQLATSQPFGLVLGEFLVAVGSLSLALYSSWELTLVLLASVPISFVVMTLISKPLEPAIQAQKRCLGEASKLATASITGIDIVKIFNGFDTEMWQYVAAMKKVTARYLVQARCNGLQMGYIEFWMITLFAVGFWYGAVLIDRGKSPGDIITTFYATLAAFQGVDALMPQFLVLSKGMVAGVSLRDLAPKARKDDEVSGDGQGMYRPGKCFGDIELKDVTFSYPSNPSKLVLKKSSFSFPAGKLTFLVGRSGSGKSTIGNLVIQFYEALTGEIRIDGYHLGALDPAWVRSNITLVQQSSILFDDTFYRNVAFGLRDSETATEEAVRCACEAALLQSTITSLPNGMNTLVGSGGYSLSGGQKQRLALARARLRDPPVLILDEVTSGLDHVARTLVMEAIREWRAGKTTIIITHDVAQIEDADYVYVMDKGRVVQEGYRKQLMVDGKALFASLVKSATDEEAGAKKLYEDDSLGPPLAEKMEVTEGPGEDMMSLKGRISSIFCGSVTGRPLSQPVILGAQFVRATRERESQLWDMDDKAADFGTYNEQLRAGLLNRLSEVSSEEAAGPDNRRCSVTSEEIPSRDPSFDFVEYMGKSTQASRLSCSEVRNRGRSATLSYPTMDGKGCQMDDPATPSSPNPCDKFHSNTSIPSIISTVWPNLFFSQRIALILGLTSCLVAAAAVPIFSYLLSRLLSSLWAPSNRLGAGQKWAIILLGIAVVDGVANFFSRYLMEYAGQCWVNTLRVEALKQILRQPKAWFDTSGNTVGKITECLDRNAEEMRNLVGRFLPSVIIVVVMVVAALVWALAISWKLTLVALSPAPLILASIKASSYFTGKWEARCNEGSEIASTISRQSFINIRVVRALMLEEYFTRKYEERVAEVYGHGIRRSLHAAFFYGFQQAMNLFITALVFYYGTEMIARQELATEAILQVTNILLFAIGSATAIVGAIPQIAAAKETSIQMLNYANLPPPPTREDEGGGKKVLTPFPIRFDGLSFAYPSRPNQQVLRNLRLRIDAGTSTAIVGPSGCGKSTLASLVLGLYSPSPTSPPPPDEFRSSRGSYEKSSPYRDHSGPVLSFGGVPWNEIDLSHLRASMSYVPQTPFIFPTTIAGNIAYGIPEQHPMRQTPNIEAAARAAGIHSFIETLPEGYATFVGDGGLTLSGGQAQRLCIARAVARWPRVLVLDEPTSALDAKSAEAIRGVIGRLVGYGAGGRMSVVVVTHCLEMMRVVERVVLLEGGFVVEEGGYEELMWRKGRFAEMVRGG
ncbi:related to STE6 - `Full-size` ABC transporter responsible for export of the `a` factor mating phe [Cephalotrichum gorgonifer]|uniref:Related to STE6 - `Full-size` ABC transporter responsible for export of the `a` factor mating phe n=1 Tax=Cephalotrichum gorgonifer TaxID=2041049 RepID=A0AAE8MX74_9PEZI|nr:related to STE6 - `Full-size` ABC transporter responsible for export of the `a` factor mating phe [Cephalotrichum gorgonifer]